MTEDIKETRLSKAAREFNVGISTIIDFLHKKGFDLEPNPNTKIPHEAYLLLVKEYSSDISVKKESEKLILKDLHRKKETLSIEDVPDKPQPEEGEREEEIIVKDSSGMQEGVDIKTAIGKPDIKLVGKIDLEKTVKKEPFKEEIQEPSKTGEPGKAEKQKTIVEDEAATTVKDKESDTKIPPEEEDKKLKKEAAAKKEKSKDGDQIELF